MPRGQKEAPSDWRPLSLFQVRPPTDRIGSQAVVPARTWINRQLRRLSKERQQEDNREGNAKHPEQNSAAHDDLLAYEQSLRSQRCDPASCSDALLRWNLKPVANVVVVPRWRRQRMEGSMDGIIYLVGLIVIILAILSFLGLR
jgi:hypothetical protein